MKFCNARFSISAISVCLTVFLFSCSPKKQPNFLFILVDDLGWSDLSCYGSTFHETPNIDRLAAEGMRFSQAYAANPVCSPTRAAIMTGKHPTRVGITDWIPGRDPKDRKLLGPQDLNEMPLEELTLAEALRDRGYRTFFAGKWHLGNEGFLPTDQGFEINKGGHHRGSPPGGYYVPYKNPQLSDGPEGEYLTDRLTEESIRFMESNKDEPFLLFLSFYTVHTPVQANKEFVSSYQTKLGQIKDSLPRKRLEHDGETLLNQVRPDYASMVHALDINIGRLQKALEALDLAENTVVIFTSDNGGLTTLAPGRMPPTSVEPLRAGKGWCYEGGIRVPLIVKAPGITSPSVSAVPVISQDFFPTIMNMAGISTGDKKLDGENLVSLLSGEGNLSRDELFWDFPHYHGSMWTPGAAIRKGNWKLIDFYDKEKRELYNLKDDMAERINLADSLPDKTDELHLRLKTLLEETGAQFPSPNPQFVPVD